MTLARNSVMGWRFVTALVAVALAPLAYLSDAGLTVLIDFRFGSLIAATFLARFGGPGHASWWLGFVTFGWASIPISIPGFWSAVDRVIVAPGVDLSDLSRSLAFWMSDVMGRSGSGIENKIVTVDGFWFTILASFVGGLVALTLERRFQPRAIRVGPEHSDRTTRWRA